MNKIELKPIGEHHKSIALEINRLHMRAILKGVESRWAEDNPDFKSKYTGFSSAEDNRCHWYLLDFKTNNMLYTLYYVTYDKGAYGYGQPCHIPKGAATTLEQIKKYTNYREGWNFGHLVNHIQELNPISLFYLPYPEFGLLVSCHISRIK